MDRLDRFDDAESRAVKAANKLWDHITLTSQKHTREGWRVPGGKSVLKK